jgi:predicted transcriptional regulator of viral defense system
MKGIGIKSRERLARVLRETGGAFSPSDVAEILAIANPQASKLLSFWAIQGWVRRVQRGLYIPIPLDSLTTEIAPEDPWIVAEKLFCPCYIGGWSAAEHWDLTEQIFSSILVFTVRRPRQREQDVSGMRFLLRTASESHFFGLKTVWRGKTKVLVSDPSRTIIDVLDDPRIGGGIRSCTDLLNNYLRSRYRNIDDLINFAGLIGNATVFKRLGFLLERYAPDETSAIQECLRRLPQGNSKLDPDLPKDGLITKWKLWVPASWQERESND